MGEFEKDLRDAFDGVEYTPSQQVWAGVEKGIRPKKKGIFVMWQTYGIAATVVLVLSLGYLFRDELFSDYAAEPAAAELTEEKPKGSEEKPANAQSTKEEETMDEPTSDPALRNDLKTNAAPGINDLQAKNSDNANGTHSGEAVNTAGVNHAADITTSTTDNTARPLANMDNNQATLIGEESDPRFSAMTRESGKRVEEKQQGEGLLINTAFMGPLSLNDLKESMAAIKNRWELNNLVGPMPIEGNEEGLAETITDPRLTSLNGRFGNSVFNPNSSLNNSTLANETLDLADTRFLNTFSARSVDQPESDLGSISVGFGVGLPLGDRWVLKTGLRYSQYRFNSTSNAYSVESGQQLPIYTRVSFDNREVFFVGDYGLTNTLHSLSIPAQFGWKFLGLGRFGSWLNIGVAADYITTYTIKGDLNFLDTRQVDFSQSNFIRRFNLNALTGMEFTYQLNEKFALSGEVYFRQFIPLTSGESTEVATPSVLGFGLGLNYYLKKKD